MGKKLIAVLIAIQFAFAVCLGAVPTYQKNVIVKKGTPYYFDVVSYSVEGRRITFFVRGYSCFFDNGKGYILEDAEGKAYFSLSETYSVDGKQYTIDPESMNYYLNKNYDSQNSRLSDNTYYYCGSDSDDDVRALGYAYNGEIVYTDFFINGVSIEDYIAG